MTDPVHHGEADRWGGWSWRDPSRGEHFRRCSYCGGVNPDDLAAEPVWRADWADFKYGWPHKFYVDIPNRNPDALFAIGAANHPQPTSGAYIAWADLTPVQLEIARRDGFDRDEDGWAYILFGTRPTHGGKFYTTHLAAADLDPDVRAAIEQRCGLAFTFDGTQVSWRPAKEPAP